MPAQPLEPVGSDPAPGDRHRRRHGSRTEEAKWRRLRWVTLALTTVAIVWLLALGSILVARSGHTVSTMTGLLRDGQQQRGAAVRSAQQEARRREAERQRQLAAARRTAEAAAARARSAWQAARRDRVRAQHLGQDVRALRSRVRQQHADRLAYVRAIQRQARSLPRMSYDPLGPLLAADDLRLDQVDALLQRIGSTSAATSSATRTTLEAARGRLALLDQRIDEAIDQLASISAHERQMGRPVDGLDRTLAQLTRIRTTVADATRRLGGALADLPARGPGAGRR